MWDVQTIVSTCVLQAVEMPIPSFGTGTESRPQRAEGRRHRSTSPLDYYLDYLSIALICLRYEISLTRSIHSISEFTFPSFPVYMYDKDMNCTVLTMGEVSK